MALRDALRTCLQIAGGLTEATRRRAVSAARELLEQTGVDVDALQRSIGERIPPEVQSLADELIASGRANRDLLLGLIREEVDKTMGRVGRVADEITKVGVILEALERRVRNLEGGTPEPEPPREWVPVRDEQPPSSAGPRHPRVKTAEPPVRPAPARKTAPAPERPEKTAPPAKKTAPAAKKATTAAKKAASRSTEQCRAD